MIPLQTPVGEIDNEEANELADEILLRGEFLGSREPGFFTRSVDRVIGWVEDFFEWLFRTVFGGVGQGAGTTMAYLLLIVALIIVGIALVRLVLGWESTRGDANAPTARIVFDEEVDPAVLRTDLAAMRAAEDWRGAVIASFRLAVVALIEQGVARERAAATTGDFGRAVDQNRPELSDAYRRAARSFDRAFYSDAPITESDHTHTSGLLEQLDRVSA